MEKIMNKRYKELTDNEIEYVKDWTSQHELNAPFDFKGWKEHYSKDGGAPSATVIGGKVTQALEQNSEDPRLDFIGLSVGPAKGGKIAEKSSKNHQYYIRRK